MSSPSKNTHTNLQVLRQQGRMHLTILRRFCNCEPPIHGTHVDNMWGMVRICGLPKYHKQNWWVPYHFAWSHHLYMSWFWASFLWILYRFAAIRHFGWSLVECLHERNFWRDRALVMRMVSPTKFLRTIHLFGTSPNIRPSLTVWGIPTGSPEGWTSLSGQKDSTYWHNIDMSSVGLVLRFSLSPVITPSYSLHGLITS